MADRKFFRTSFRGFSKEDVLNHIDSLHAQQQEELKQMQEQVALAEEASAAARAEADAVIALPAEQLAELEQLREAVAAYTVEVAQLKQQIAENDREMVALLEQQRRLQGCLDDAQAFAAQAMSLSDTLAAQVADYRRISAVQPTEETPAVVEADATAVSQEEPAVEPAEKPAMADWLF